MTRTENDQHIHNVNSNDDGDDSDIYISYILTMTRTENDQNILTNISHNDHGSSFSC
jgi:hypothetical protein